jgi:acetyl esterase/lipase
MRDKLRGAGKSVELVEFNNLDHQIDSSSKRSEMLLAIDNFLTQSTMR